MGLTTYDDEFLLAAIVIISMALIFYSVGVWSERIQGRLKGWHVTAFGLGIMRSEFIFVLFCRYCFYGRAGAAYRSGQPFTCCFR